MMRASSNPPAVPALDAATCTALLRKHGMAPNATSTIRPLGGGVSNIVFAVENQPRPLIVKQSLPRLRVADDWPAPMERLLTEAEALRLAADLTPDDVPPIAFVDHDLYALAEHRAPLDWRDWKTLLLAGIAAPAVAARLGHVLATWHNATRNRAGLPARLLDPQPYELLRLDPYYRTVARRAPDLAPTIEKYLNALRDGRSCLVHGDFSPKNVLVSPDAQRLWVIDFEVAHYGDPAFDVAFLLSHLVLKSLHRPERASGYDACAASFIRAYQHQVDPGLMPERRYILGHVGCLLLARVRGKSPAEYLDQAQRAWDLGKTLATHPVEALDDLFALRDAAHSSDTGTP